MSKIEPRVLKGFRDYLPEVMIPRQRMLTTIERVFHLFGFSPLMTPALEYFDILSGKYGDEGESLLYRFEDNGGRDVALRYDLTVPLARVVAQYGELTLPFRRYQIAPVWRAEKPARGRFREFVQCDGDIVGSADMVADGEILHLASALLDELGVRGYALRINNRKVLSGLMRAIGISEGAGEMGALRTIDKLPKIGVDETRSLLRSENGLTDEQAAKVFDFLAIAGSNGEILDRLDEFSPEGSIGRDGARELRELFSIVDALGISSKVTIDLSIARGLNYYTGTIYEAFLTDLPGYGAVMGGGRYDGLVGVFQGEDVPAVGISLGIDRLLQGLVELGLLESVPTVTRVLVTVFDAASVPQASALARDLRRGGVSCELFPQVARLKKQFKHAERLAMRWVVVAGPDELSAGTVTIKDLTTGAQESIPRGAAADYLRERISAPNSGVVS
jgi:histidyl-tRNA synthetase